MEAYDAVNDALAWGNPPHRRNDWEELYDQGYRSALLWKEGALLQLLVSGRGPEKHGR